MKSLRFASGMGSGPQTQTRRTANVEETSSAWFGDPGLGLESHHRDGDSIASRGVRPRMLLPHGRF